MDVDDVDDEGMLVDEVEVEVDEVQFEEAAVLEADVEVDGVDVDDIMTLKSTMWMWKNCWWTMSSRGT